MITRRWTRSIGCALVLVLGLCSCEYVESKITTAVVGTPSFPPPKVPARGSCDNTPAHPALHYSLQHARNRRRWSESRTVILRVDLVVGATVVHKRGPNIRQYCESMLKTVNSYYEPLNVTLHLAGVSRLPYDIERHIATNVRRRVLFAFRRHMRTAGAGVDPSKYDVALMLTELSSASERGEMAPATWGVTFVGGACVAGSSVGVVGTSGARGDTELALAHELGHLLGLGHDQDPVVLKIGGTHRRVPACPSPEREQSRHVMSEMITGDTRAAWSACSLHTWTMFRRLGGVHCLRTK